MRFAAIVSVVAVAVFFSCCLHQSEGHGILKLVKAGLILKALSPKKILLPIPIPIPIGIHKSSHHHAEPHYGGHGHSFGHGFGHHDISFGHSFGSHGGGHSDYGHHAPIIHKSGGWRIEGIGFGKHHF